MSEEYRALVAKVSAFTAAVEARRADAFACRRGCDACCHAWLTVSAVEADQVRRTLATLSPEARADIAARGRHEAEREARGEREPRCAMLDAAGACAVYDGRPLVCRTQGHALRYPPGFVPREAVRGTLPSGELTHCPLNYEDAAPSSADVLDAERVDQILAVVNARFASATDVSATERVALSALAAEADVLERRG